MKNFVVETINDLEPVINEIIVLAKDQKIWAFIGEMGSGKTTLIREICVELGVNNMEVNSPTFAIVNEYHSYNPLKTIYHFDFYRINSVDEAFDLGYEEYFYNGNLCFIEWPQKIAAIMPDPCGVVRIQVENNGIRNILVGIE